MTNKNSSVDFYVNEAQTSEEIREQYRPFLQGNLTNSFTAINNKTAHKENLEVQQHSFTLKELGITVNLTNANESKLSITSSKLIDIITLYLSPNLPYKADESILANYTELDIDINGYMKYLGYTSKNDAVKQLKKDLNTLYNASTTANITVTKWINKKPTKVQEPMTIRYIDAKPAGAIRQTAHINLALSFVKYLSQNAQIMNFYTPLLLKDTNSNSYYLGKKLLEHFNMNGVNSHKANKDSIKVESLLNYTPDIPTLKQEKDKGRHYRERCIEPLEKTLDRLVYVGLLKEWYFMNADKQSLTNTQLTQYYTTYKEWNNLYIHFVIKDYPEKQKKIESKQPKK